MKPVVAIAATLCLLLAACTSTRILSAPDDPRLRTPDHHGGFIVHTTSPWRAHIDPNTTLRFRNGSGQWSETTDARDLYVDDAGVWTDHQMPVAETIDAVRIFGITAVAATALAETRPYSGAVAWDGRAWSLTAPPQDLAAWLNRIELAIARQLPGTPASDDAKLYELRVTQEGTPLGRWVLHDVVQGWENPVAGPVLLAVLTQGQGRRAGWHWSDVTAVEVQNISGGKTLGGIIGYAALTVALAPLALVMPGSGLSFRGDGGGGGGGGGGAGTAVLSSVGGGGGGGGGSAAPATWTPVEAEVTDGGARPLFSLGTRIRALALPTLSLDTTLAGHGDLITSGASARVRFIGLIELGGGVGSSETHDAMGWHHSTTGNFQLGLHLPMDAGGRIAVPLGFQVGGGGEVGLDLRIPWGLRYTSASGRWFVTAQPATPTYSRTRGEMARWSLAAGAEVGMAF